MILSTHDFRCHVSWCAGRVLGIFCFQNLGDAHVSDSDISIVLHDYILGFNISMNDTLIVHILQAQHHAGQHELGFFLIEPSALADMVAQVAACQQITDQV